MLTAINEACSSVPSFTRHDMATEYIDARHSTINRVGRDQMVNHHYHILYISPGSLRLRSRRIADNIGNNLSLPVDNTETLLPPNLMVYSSSAAVAIVHSATSLIETVAELLMDYRQSPSGYWDLALELESLKKTLTLCRLIIHKYNDKPLGQSLTNAITPEVLACFFVLQELINSVDTCVDFSLTSIGGWCHQIWWNMFDGDEFTSVRKKLCRSRQLLQGLLMALHS